MFTKEDTNRVKGIAILLLIFHHMYRTLGDVSLMAGTTFFLTDEDLTIVANCFRVCVYIFAFLSAFGMSAGCKEKDGLIKNYAYRLWRLLAPYWFTLILCNLIYIVAMQKFAYANPLYFLGDVIPVLDIFRHSDDMFNGVFWYMNFTLIVVVMLPILHFLTKKFKFWPFLVTMLIYRFIPKVIISPLGGDYLSYVFVVELGVLFQQYDVLGKVKTAFLKFNGVVKGVCLIGLLVIAALCPYAGWFIIPENPYGIRPMMHTLGAIAVILIGSLYLNNRVTGKPLEFIGQYSYDMFLTHVMVYTTVLYIIRVVHFVIFEYIVSAFICFLAAYALALLKKRAGWLMLIEKVSKKIKSWT